jgi:hypothetical protein
MSGVSADGGLGGGAGSADGPAGNRSVADGGLGGGACAAGGVHAPIQTSIAAMQATRPRINISPPAPQIERSLYHYRAGRKTAPNQGA